MNDELAKHLRFCGKCNDAMECDYCEYKNTTEYVDRSCCDGWFCLEPDRIDDCAECPVKDDCENYKDWLD